MRREARHRVDLVDDDLAVVGVEAVDPGQPLAAQRLERRGGEARAPRSATSSGTSAGHDEPDVGLGEVLGLEVVELVALRRRRSRRPRWSRGAAPSRPSQHRALDLAARRSPPRRPPWGRARGRPRWRPRSSSGVVDPGDADARPGPRRLDEHRPAQRGDGVHRRGRVAAATARSVIDHVRPDRQAVPGEDQLHVVLVHPRRRGEHAGADVADVRSSSRPWSVPSSPNGPCSSGNTTSTSPSSRGGWPGSSDGERALARSPAARRTSAPLAVDLGHVARRVSSQRLRVVGGEHPPAVAGDADRHDVVRVAVDRAQHAGRGGAGDGVLRGAAAEDDGDAGAGRPAGRAGAGPCSSAETLSPHRSPGRPYAGAAASLTRDAAATDEPRPRLARGRRRPPAARARAPRQRARRAHLDVCRRRPGQLRPHRQPDLDRVRGGARRRWRAATRWCFASGMAAIVGRAVARPRRRHGRRARRNAYNGTGGLLRRPRRRPAARPCARVDITDTAAVARRPRRRRPALARVADQPDARGRRPAGASPRRPASAGAIARRRQHLRHPAAAAAARARRRRRRALGDQVPLRPLRRRPRRHRHRRHRRGRELRRAAAAPPHCCTAAIAGPMEAWLALRGLRTLHAAGRAGQRQRRRARPPAGGPPGGRSGCATPGSGAIVVDRGAPAARRPPSAVAPPTAALAARDQPRRRRVADRAPAPARRRSRRRSRRACCGCRSASRTSRTSGATSTAPCGAGVAGEPERRPRLSAPASGRLGLAGPRHQALGHLAAAWHRRGRPRRPARRSACRRRASLGELEDRLAGLHALGGLPGRPRPPPATAHAPARASPRRCGCATAATCTWR